MVRDAHALAAPAFGSKPVVGALTVEHVVGTAKALLTRPAAELEMLYDDAWVEASS